MESSEPTCSCFWYFLRMLSLWYFQNCFDASLPATRCSTVACQCRPERVRRATPTLLSSGMLVLELGQIVHVLIDNDPQIVGLVVRRHVGG